MKKLLILTILFFVTACTLTDKAKNIKIRKDCAEAEGNKTLSDVFCKKD